MFLGFVGTKNMPPKKRRKLSLRGSLSCFSDKKVRVILDFFYLFKDNSSMFLKGFV
jgi:hypothetical protein